jgi:hypothetical protein
MLSALAFAALFLSFVLPVCPVMVTMMRVILYRVAHKHGLGRHINGLWRNNDRSRRFTTPATYINTKAKIIRKSRARQQAQYSAA